MTQGAKSSFFSYVNKKLLNWTKNFILFALLFLQKAVKMLIDNIDKVPVRLVMMFFDFLLSFTEFVQPSKY